MCVTVTHMPSGSCIAATFALAAGDVAVAVAVAVAVVVVTAAAAAAARTRSTRRFCLRASWT